MVPGILDLKGFGKVWIFMMRLGGHHENTENCWSLVSRALDPCKMISSIPQNSGGVPGKLSQRDPNQSKQSKTISLALWGSNKKKSVICDHVGIILAWLWDNFGISFGWLWDHFGIMLGSFWDHFGIILESFWDHCGTTLGLCCDHFGMSLGSFWDKF